MTTLADACAELATWLPAAAQLITEPDTQPSAGGGKPGSSPPWNSGAANAYYDAHALIRDTEQWLRFIVTGASADVRPWSDVHLEGALKAIQRLGAAVDGERAGQAAARLTSAVTQILQLPAIDRSERFIRPKGANCPYCGPKGFTGTLRAGLQTGRVACIRYGACQDSDGNTPTGLMGRRQIDGSPCVTWADGLVT